MIDAHVHLWQVGKNDCRWPGADLPAIYRDYGLDDLIGQLDAHGVGTAILVQSQESEADTHWLLALARRSSRIAGVIGWTDLFAFSAERINALMASGPLLGLRPMMQDGPEDGYDDPAMAQGLAYVARRGLVLDALVRPRHLASLLRLARRLPDLPIVIDHGAKPAVGKFMPADWRAAMAALAACPNVACKISGLMTELAPGAGDEDVRPFIAELFALFGPDRLIWGSDWPVSTLATSYGAWRDLVWDEVPERARFAVFSGNAARIYRAGRAGVA